MSVKCHVKGKKSRVTFPSTRSQAVYMKYFNAVDRNDRDSSDYTMSQRTHRWYLRIYFSYLTVQYTGVLLLLFPSGKSTKVGTRSEKQMVGGEIFKFS